MYDLEKYSGHWKRKWDLENSLLNYAISFPEYNPSIILLKFPIFIHRSSSYLKYMTPLTSIIASVSLPSHHSSCLLCDERRDMALSSPKLTLPLGLSFSPSLPLSHTNGRESSNGDPQTRCISISKHSPTDSPSLTFGKPGWSLNSWTILSQDGNGCWEGKPWLCHQPVPLSH